MSPRKPAALRGGGGSLREHLIATAARLIGERGSAGLSVRDLAREAQVADGALYNYFADKDDLLAHGLLAHVGAVMSGAPPMPAAGTGTVAGNLALFIDQGLDVLGRVAPAFAGLQSQPGVLTRFQAMVGGHAAFGVADGDVAGGAGGEAGRAAGGGESSGAGPGAAAGGAAGSGPGPEAGGPRGLPDLLTAYLDAEQQLGRVSAAADIDAAVMLVVGAIHGQVLPQVLLGRPGRPAPPPPAFAGRLAAIVMNGLAPG
jgi:AcrR family transcriptional regulator